MNLLSGIFIFSFTVICQCFLISSSVQIRHVGLSMNGGESSYAEKLREARAKTRKNISALEPSVQTELISSPSDERHTLELEKHLNTAISILSERLASGKPLKQEQFDQFEASARAIIADAKPHLAESHAIDLNNAKAETISPVSDDDNDDIDSEDDFESEGPAWDPSEGYGIAPGTANSYIIEGMAAMSPEEYQEALRKKVVNRAQTARRTGSYGNRAANAYLSFLNDRPSWNADNEVPDEDFKEY